MKIYNRAAFMALPAGVLFSKGIPVAFRGFCVKGDALYGGDRAIDFSVRALDDWESSNSLDSVERFHQMLEQGASVPMNEDYGRDGMFDNEEVFLVWERQDLLVLSSIINMALAVGQLFGL